MNDTHYPLLREDAIRLRDALRNVTEIARNAIVHTTYREPQDDLAFCWELRGAIGQWLNQTEPTELAD